MGFVGPTRKLHETSPVGARDTRDALCPLRIQSNTHYFCLNVMSTTEDSLKRPLEVESPVDADAKRIKVDGEVAAPGATSESSAEINQDGSGTTTNGNSTTASIIIPPKLDNVLPMPVSRLGLKPVLPTLPASLELVRGVKTDLEAQQGFVGQEHVGIIGYAGPSNVKGIKGVIKQR